jgi:hypothetical protein
MYRDITLEAPATPARLLMIRALNCPWRVSMMKGLQAQSNVRRLAASGKRAARWVTTTAAVSLWSQVSMAAPPTTPAGLDAVMGGDSVVLMWAGSTGDTSITRYNVYRDGVIIGTSSTANPGTVYRRGTRFTDWGIVPGVTYSYQVQAIDGNGVVSELSPATVAATPIDTTPPPQVLLDASLAPDLTSWANEHVLPEVRAWYPKIADLILYPDESPRQSFTIKFDPRVSTAAADWQNGIIMVNPGHARSNPQDLGVFIHEFTHIIQAYPGLSRGWVVEGMADWAREYIYKDRAPIVPKLTDSYIQGYSQGSLLLEYFRQRINPDSVRKANHALRNEIYHDKLLTQRSSASSVDAVWLRMLNASGQNIRTGSVSAAAFGGKCLDNYAHGRDDGNPIVTSVCTGADNQFFSAVLNPDGAYSLRIHDKCLDVTSGGTANGTPVQLNRCNWTGAQKWHLTGTTLVNPQSGRCLDAGDLDAGGQTRIWDCNGTVAQQWNVAVSTPTGHIRGISLSDKCIENSVDSGYYGDPLLVGSCGANDDQRWTVVPVGGNVVLTVHGNGCMDVRASGTANGTPIQHFACNGSSAQQWTVLSSGLLRNPNSGRCLSTNNSGNDGTPFVLADCDNNAYQRWRLPGQTLLAFPAPPLVLQDSVRITSTP